MDPDYPTRPVPIVPGAPPQPPPYYPTQPPPPYYAQAPVSRDPNRGVRTAGTLALWVWIVITVGPVLLLVVCCGLCAFGGIVGGAGSPSSSPR